MIETVLRVAADFLEDSSKRAQKARRNATKAAEGLREEVSDRAERVATAARKRFRPEPEPSIGGRFALFLAGLGVGAALGVLLAPKSGEDTRQSLYDQANDVAERVRSSVRRGVSDLDDDDGYDAAAGRQ